MSSKILVTGGAGYLGSVLVPALLNAGHEVTVVDNFMFQQSSLVEQCMNPKFKVYRDDARNEKLMTKLLNEHDVVIPLAALVGAPLCNRDSIGTETTNYGAVNMITKIAPKDLKIMMPVTNSGYGIGQEGIECTEETPLNPISSYGITKVQAEKDVLERGNCITFRLATVFGMAPRMRLDLLVNDFTYRAVKDRFIVIFEGQFKRNYIHIRDIARVFLHGLENFEKMKNQPYNVGLSDANLSKLELCARIKEHVSDFVYLESAISEDPDKRDYIVSNAKIEATGWKPKYSLDAGIDELIKGYTIIVNSKYSNV